MKLMDQRTLLETKDALVAKTKEKLARSANMQVRHAYIFFSHFCFDLLSAPLAPILHYD